MKLAYYNEIDPGAAQWLRNLIAEGVIAPGDVDERDVRDVKPVELLGYTQCHFFAGIGVWSYALRIAGWPDDRPVWTGSCPCQPFSAAGKGKGFTDERHVWPFWHYLIRFGCPPVIFGEQVSSPDGLGWFDLVHADLEGEGYTARPLDSCSAGVGAPHLRQRLWFMAYPKSVGSGAGLRNQRSQRIGWSEPSDDSHIGRMAHTDFGGFEAGSRAFPAGPKFEGWDGLAEQRGTSGFVGNPERQGLEERGYIGSVRTGTLGPGARKSALRSIDPRIVEHAGSARRTELGRRRGQSARPSPASCTPGPGPTNGYWRTADWLGCRDDKWRPVEPGTFPLADGVAGRVGLLRGYGNAINPYNAAAMIVAGAAELEAA